jgi:hypothetical protein
MQRQQPGTQMLLDGGPCSLSWMMLRHQHWHLQGVWRCCSTTAAAYVSVSLAGTHVSGVCRIILHADTRQQPLVHCSIVWCLKPAVLLQGMQGR